MKIVFDPRKSERNRRQRGLPFDDTADFDWETAIYREDTRKPYPESRFLALGFLDERLHALCFTPTAEGIRIISFRKANAREVRRYHEEKEIKAADE
ncbi:MAG: BrnT family toxin [Proteobacteria bacterium]|nr:BrnT family toxin [Pseudomonadota bacterium]